LSPGRSRAHLGRLKRVLALVSPAVRRRRKKVGPRLGTICRVQPARLQRSFLDLPPAQSGRHPSRPSGVVHSSHVTSEQGGRKCDLVPSGSRFGESSSNHLLRREGYITAARLADFQAGLPTNGEGYATYLPPIACIQLGRLSSARARLSSRSLRMARAIAYYVHESWWDGQFTVALHRGDCIHCDQGRGQLVGSFLRRGKWHGPYKNRSKAVAKLASVAGITVRVLCECVQCETRKFRGSWFPHDIAADYVIVEAALNRASRPAPVSFHKKMQFAESSGGTLRLSTSV
jgi:hypothetical protein